MSPASSLHDALELADEGFAIHWLYPRSKRPRGDDWSKKPVASVEDLERSYRDGFNVGIRLGEPSKVCGLYAHVLDIDIRDGDFEDEALDALDAMLPGWEKFPRVKSGSGGPSIHIYLFTKSPFRSKKLAHSTAKIESTDAEGKRHKHWAWEIELFGTGKQVACPPSIHPDTGKPYRWLKRINFDDLDLGLGPVLMDSQVEAWASGSGDEDRGSSTPEDSSPGSLSNLVQNKPLGLSPKEARQYLDLLDFDSWCFDYDGWLKVGMALHHEFEGDDEGLELWHEFSEQAENYEEDAVDDKWRSFGKDKRRRPVRFATLIAAGAQERALRELAGAESREDMDKEAEDEDNDTSWLGRLDLNEKAQIKPHLNNVTLIFENDPRLKKTFAFNEFTGEPTIRRVPAIRKAKTDRRQKHFRQLEGDLWRLNEYELREGRPVEDAHMEAVRLLFETPAAQGGWGFRVTDRDLYAARNIVAQQNRFHPIREYLEKQEWDGKERLDTLFVDYLGCPDTPYHREAARLFLVGAISRVYVPGHKFDFAPIIEGPQGVRKSTFIRTLARDWFVEYDTDFDNPQRAVEALRGRWIAELPELSQFGKSDVNRIKSFMTKEFDQVRLAYRKDQEVIYRQAVFCGSTNDDRYFRDQTGNRRFWPIKVLVDQIDTDRLRGEIDQIWAEAYEEYLWLCERHDPKRLPLYMQNAEAAAEAAELQASRVVETQADALAGVIQQWADTKIRLSELNGAPAAFERQDGDNDPLVRRESICGLEAWIEALDGSKESYLRQNSMRVMEAIRKLPGWQEVGLRRHRHYGPQRVFVRVQRKRTLDDIL